MPQEKNAIGFIIIAMHFTLTNIDLIFDFTNYIEVRRSLYWYGSIMTCNYPLALDPYQYRDCVSIFTIQLLLL